MMQVFSLKLAKTTTNSSPIQLYGYIAARDVVDSMLNFVFNRSRDDPIVVQQGSIIEMTGPKRGIGMVADVIFEFDMRIKNGEKEEDDLQLIDEIIEIDDNVVTMIGTPRTFRLSGDCGPVDMSMAIFDNAVEATVEVAISELHYGFDLSISYVLSELEENREFQLFRGAIGESCGLRRFVIAVNLDTLMHLKFKVHKEGSNFVAPLNLSCTDAPVKK
ncbi:Os12g0228350 [Oryza sativa Japonica Group]|uniref:Os12g0228350 protein n=1 Tax=Oryza sativa subsp. japonica TaxID=39947 RepID=A0A0P0Y8I8_ORYSJ|nr:Os12g0228350 [Oryza sativa Japonica Group]